MRLKIYCYIVYGFYFALELHETNKKQPLQQPSLSERRL
jgi:hypothetical protein